jgi:hypothetical protein
MEAVEVWKPVVGFVLNGWTLLEVPARGAVKVMCRCACGKVFAVNIINLRYGYSKRCKSCAGRKIFTKHGASDCGRSKAEDRLYRIWKAMNWRCNPKNRFDRHLYFARGVSVCQEWSGDYLAFRDWALANGYGDSLTIDRRDNDCGYSPDNCRWASYQQQARNKQKTVILTAFEETKTAEEWGEDPRCTVCAKTLRARLRRGFPEQDAVSLPLRSSPVRRLLLRAAAE